MLRSCLFPRAQSAGPQYSARYRLEARERRRGIELKVERNNDSCPKHGCRPHVDGVETV